MTPPARSVTTTWIFNILRCSTAVCCLFAASCGLVPEGPDEDNKQIYIDIPDPAFREVCLRACDSNGDGRISRYEAQRVIDLSCPDAQIASVDGVGEFTRLRSFNCSGNLIASLDLGRNVLLERLNCSNNQVAYLNIKGLLLLNDLRCADNRLMLLDLVGESSLSVIDCARNRLTTLDISTCAREIALLDTRGNAQLTTVYISPLQTIRDQQIDGQTQVVVGR